MQHCNFDFPFPHFFDLTNFEVFVLHSFLVTHFPFFPAAVHAFAFFLVGFFFFFPEATAIGCCFFVDDFFTQHLKFLPLQTFLAWTKSETLHVGFLSFLSFATSTHLPFLPFTVHFAFKPGFFVIASLSTLASSMDLFFIKNADVV
jgi:hypothetical protein